MLLTLPILLVISSVAASSHSDNDSEEHKSGYGYVDRAADFGHDNAWIDENHRHNADSHLSQGTEEHSSREKFADSGSKKHSDEAVNRGKDSKHSNYGFFDYHFVEPEYCLERFYTTEQRSRKFDEGQQSHAAARHQHNKDHANRANQHQAENSHSKADKLDRAESGHHGHKDAFDEHYNQLDKSAHTFDSSSGPFKDGHYVPRFGPY